MKQIYLDYAAATPMSQACREAMEPYFIKDFYNPSATYLSGRKTKDRLNGFRDDIAKLLGAKPSEVIFTAGATEANNLAVHGIMSQYPDGEVVVSTIEHESVARPAGRYKYKKASVDRLGEIELDSLQRALSEKTVLVSIIYASNEIGTVQDLSCIATLLQKNRLARQQTGNKLPLYFHTDAAQAAGYLDIHPGRLGVDMLSLNGGKIYGPKQSGALFIKKGTKLLAQTLGGGQEYDLRSGTENIAFAAGLASSLVEAQQRRHEERKRLGALKEEFATKLQNLNNSITVNGASKRTTPHILSVCFNGTDNERLMMQLDEAGVICAQGSACSASSSEPSSTLSAIGLSPDQARATLRFSFGRQTTSDQLNTVFQIIKQLLSN